VSEIEELDFFRRILSFPVCCVSAIWLCKVRYTRNQSSFEMKRFETNRFEVNRFEANRFEANRFEVNRFEANRFEANRF